MSMAEIPQHRHLVVRVGLFIWMMILWFTYPLRWFVQWAWHYNLVVLAFMFTNTVTFARTRWGWLWSGYEPSDDAFGRLIERWVGDYMNNPWIRIPFSIAALIIGTPFMALSVLAIGYGVPVIICLAIDQYTYPRHELAAKFSHDGPNAERALSDEEKGVLVTDAIVYQLEAELASVTDMTWQDWRTLNFNGFWGWTPNDLATYGPLAWPRLFDNRANRQRGTIYMVRKLTETWSIQTSKLGSADRESAHLLDAYQEGFNQKPEFWFLPAAESRYNEGIEHVRTYQQKLLSGANDATINVTTKNLATVLEKIHEALQEPHGRLVDRNANVRWSELDDAVYYAQGASIVARDVLAALSIAYAEEFQRGQLDGQIEEAIDSFNAAATFNPLFVLRGDHDSMLADHRAKEARYITEAMGRIEDIAEALRN